MSSTPKHIYLEVPDYDFYSPDNSFFIGRKEALKRLERRIRPLSKRERKGEGKKKRQLKYSGAYLVAGYRGMGKSTLVRESIENVNRQTRGKAKLVPITINLSQQGVSDYDFLRQLYLQLRDKIDNSFGVWQRLNRVISSNLTYFFLLTMFIYWQRELILNVLDAKDVLLNYSNASIQVNNSHEKIYWILMGIVLLGVFFLSKTLLKWMFHSLFFPSTTALFKRLEAVDDRLQSELELSEESSLATLHDKVDSSFLQGFLSGASLLSGKNKNKRQSFHKLTFKELEYEVHKVLEVCQNTLYFRNSNLLFVVDELDKIEPEYVQHEEDFFSLGKSNSERRKETLAKLLANLKSFINTSSAKFIFIGGADMYDSSLADVADRESFYSSIFSEVIYVNSFFKDSIDTGSRRPLLQLAEHFFIKVMVGDRLAEHLCSLRLFYRIYVEPISNLSVRDRAFLVFQVYRFIAYLAYRSNGSPKKMKELLEYNMANYVEPADIDDSLVLRWEISGTSRRLILSDSTSLVNHNPRSLFFRLTSKQQFKIGSFTSIVLPFIQGKGNYMSNLNDKNLYLSAFLLDHILKFHKSAFSWKGLELMPDIIMGSKGPNLRNTLNDLIEHLLQKHLRRTTNAMFQYKFRSRFSKELMYLSKVSDESAAAFNFTYDESHHLKSFFKRKLKQKVDSYANNKSIPDGITHIHTLAHINSTIADIHYYDEEYDSAIRYYSDAIQALRDLMVNREELHYHQKILYARNSLLLSLCLEKTHKFDSAYSIIRGVILDNSRFYHYSLPSNGNIGNYRSSLRWSDHSEDDWEDPFKRMQLFLRPHLALLLVIEKDRSDGVTFSNLQRNIKEYTEFMELVDLFPSREFQPGLPFRQFFRWGTTGDHKRIQTLLSDYYQSVGSILFYKNRNFKSLHEWCAAGILDDYLRVLDMPINNIGVTPAKIRINGVERLNPRNYLTFQNIRLFYEKTDQHHYYPSFSSSFYYIISLGHVLYPYVENLMSMYGRTAEDIKTDHLFILEELLCEIKTRHVLNGPQRQLVGLILSKLSDSILSSIGTIEELPNYLIVKDDLDLMKMDSAFWDVSYKSEEDNCRIGLRFEDLYSMRSVFYTTILSYRAYSDSGLYHDAFFQLKKILYIIKTIFSSSKNVQAHSHSWFPFLLKFAKIVHEAAEDLLQNRIQPNSAQEASDLGHIMGSDFVLDDYFSCSDEAEISILYKSIQLNYSPSEERESHAESFRQHLEDHSGNLVDHIFVRIQRLKFNTRLYYLKYQGLFEGHWLITNNLLIIRVPHTTSSSLTSNEVVADLKKIDYCYRELIDITKTYGENYLMSFAFLGSIYRSYATWVLVYEQLKQSWPLLRNSIPEAYYNHQTLVNETRRYYQRCIDLHSEGHEYKEMVKEIYLLEDDLNDSLTHFFAAMERSLINLGVIGARMDSLL